LIQTRTTIREKRKKYKGGKDRIEYGRGRKKESGGEGRGKAVRENKRRERGKPKSFEFDPKITTDVMA